MEQPDFKTTYIEASELLKNSEENVRVAESRLTKSEEEMKAEIEKMVEEKAEELTRIFIGDVNALISPHLGDFSPELGEQLLRKILSRKEWQKNAIEKKQY